MNAGCSRWFVQESSEFNQASHLLAIALDYEFKTSALRGQHVVAITVPLLCRCQTFAPSFSENLPKTPGVYQSVWIEQPWWARRNGVRTKHLEKPYYSPRVQQSASSVGTVSPMEVGRAPPAATAYAWYSRSRLQTLSSGPKAVCRGSAAHQD